MKIELMEKTVDTGDQCWHLTHENGWMEGCIHKKGINIWAVLTEKKGVLKEMMNELVEHFKEDRITFTMVINDNLMTVLRGFKPHMEYHVGMKEHVPCLSGVWNKV